VKPQIEGEALDGRDRSPHLRAMADDDKDRKGATESREAKLAQALRANLRRRKAANAPPSQPNPRKTSAD